MGLEITYRVGDSAAFLSAGGPYYHIRLHAERRDASDPRDGALVRSFSLRYPTRAALADAAERLLSAGVPLEAAITDEITESLHVRDPDGNGVELYWERPRDKWPHPPERSLAADPRPLDLESLKAAGQELAGAAQIPESLRLSETMRTRLRDMRARLLNLHKVLLEDAKSAYELDRGRVGSKGSLLQLVISDPWFAWLHPLSELVVRIDETLQPDAPARESDGAVLLDQVARLLSPEQGPGEFARRYYEAIQRQPAVIVAHAEVRRILKEAK